MFAFGYRYGEVRLPLIDPIGDEVDGPVVEERDVHIRSTPAPRLGRRVPVQVSLGCHVEGIAAPHVDPNDPMTIEAGVRKRFCRMPPTPNQRLFQKLKQFTIRFCKERLVPLPRDADTSFDTWLSKTNYPEGRRCELRAKWDACGRTLRSRHKRVKSFIKDETYPEFKHARAINSRSDEFKCAFGPIVKLIEEVVYELPEFIKKVPVAERPAHLLEALGSDVGQWFWADFVSMESHFLPAMFRAVLFPVYRYMTQNLPNHKEIMSLFHTLAGLNHCSFKYLIVIVLGRRMSGEMDTSLGNGLTNLIVLLFLFARLGEKPRCRIEGDDSNSHFIKRHPTVEDFAQIGFTVKCGTVTSPSEMSFCGLIYDPVDRINLADPCRVLSTLGWARMAYTSWRPSKLRMLLKMKALSYAHQYPGCPIVQSMAHYVLRSTSRVQIQKFVETNRHISYWERESFYRDVPDFSSPLPKEVPMNTRLLCEKMFGIDVAQQLAVERYLDGLDTITPLRGPVLDLPFDRALSVYYDRYTGLYDRLSPTIDYPDVVNAKHRGHTPEFTAATRAGQTYRGA